MSLETITQVAETIPQATETVQQTFMLSIDWNEVILLVIGAVIGLLASLATIVIQRHLDQKGKLNIFYRFTNQKGTNGRGWGFESSHDGYLYLSIPVVFELQNTSNTTRVIRDVSLLLYQDARLIGKMVQIDYLQATTRKGGTVTKETEYHYGTEKGSYSFVLAPRSIQRQECHYAYKIKPIEKDDNTFNQIIVRYYDEKNTAHYFAAKTIDNSWEAKLFDPDEEWVLLEKKVL